MRKIKLLLVSLLLSGCFINSKEKNKRKWKYSNKEHRNKKI